MFGMPRKGEVDYSVDLELDLADVQPSVAGPKRPQDRLTLPEVQKNFRDAFKDATKKKAQIELHGENAEIESGAVVIAARSREFP